MSRRAPRANQRQRAIFYAAQVADENHGYRATANGPVPPEAGSETEPRGLAATAVRRQPVWIADVARSFRRTKEQL